MRLWKAWFAALRVSLLCAGTTLVFAGSVKASELQHTVDLIAEHGLLDAKKALIAGPGLVALEVLVGILAIAAAIGTVRHAATAALCVAGVIATFAAYALAMTLRPPTEVPCGCPLSGNGAADWAAIALRNGIASLWYSGLSLIGLIGSRRGIPAPAQSAVASTAPTRA